MKKLILFSVLSLNTSCFQQVNKEMASISSSPSLEKTEEKALVSTAFIEGTLNESWWEVFQDPQLSAIIEDGIEMSPTLQKAEAKVLYTQAEAKKVRSSLFPNISAKTEDQWTYLSKFGFFRDFFPLPPGEEIPHKYNRIDLSLNFSYEIDFFGKNRKRLKAALGQALAEEMEKREARLILSSSICFAYFEWQSHFAEKELLLEKLRLAEKAEELLSQRFERGLDEMVPPLTQKQQIGEIKLKIENKEKELILDSLVLKQLAGLGPDAEFDLSFVENSYVKPPLPSNLGLDLLAKRPDLMAQLFRVESAREEIGVAKTEFYPNVNLVALAGLSSLTFSHLFKWASRTGALHPAINLPVFTGGKLMGNLKGKLALFNEAVFGYNETLLLAAKEVASEITSYLSLEEQVGIQEEQIARRKELKELASSRFTKGIDRFLPVLYSEIEVLDEKLYEVQLQEYKTLSFVKLIKALGGGQEDTWTK